MLKIISVNRLIFSVGLLALPGGALAGEGVGADNETVVQMEAKVVDIACELGGACPPDCGGGKHQLGLLTKDGKLRPAVKSATIFASPQFDLLPYCGKTVSVDGLLVENPRMTIYFVQGIRPPGGGEFAGTDAFEKQWFAKYKPSEEWFRNDPLVKQVIEKDGILGVKGLVPKPQ